MSKGVICIDRDKTIAHLNRHLMDIEGVVAGMAHKDASFATGIGWIKGCIDIVSRQFRVSHDVGKCVPFSSMTMKARTAIHSLRSSGHLQVLHGIYWLKAPSGLSVDTGAAWRISPGFHPLSKK